MGRDSVKCPGCATTRLSVLTPSAFHSGISAFVSHGITGVNSGAVSSLLWMKSG
jgi:hypothetical protein